MFLVILIYVIALSFFFLKCGSTYTQFVTFDFMSIYVKGVSSNIGKMYFVEKWSILTQNAMDLGTYMSVDAEIWFGDRFWSDTKTLCWDF